MSVLDGVASGSDFSTLRGAAMRSGVLSRQADFAEVLGTADRRLPEHVSDEAAARDAAQRFVAATLVQPILDQIRETNDAAPPFQPTRGEKQFGSMLDARVAMDIVRASNFPLVDRMARDLLTRGGVARDAGRDAAVESRPGERAGGGSERV
jgi:hypothetical protein